MAKNAYIGVSNVARKVKQPYIGVSNVARKVKNGYIGVSNVARQFYQSGTPVSTLAVGSSVWMNVSGVATEFLVVHQGNPDTGIYDSSCNGTWLLMKNIYETRRVHSSSTIVMFYANTEINTYLNSTMLGLFDNSIQSLIKQVKIPYNGHTATGTANAVAYTGTNGTPVKLFLLSIYEYGHETTSTIKQEGAKLSYFLSGKDESSANAKRIAYYNGAASLYWTRSRNYQGQHLGIMKTGAATYANAATNAVGIRPALILPSTALVNDSGFVIAS